MIRLLSATIFVIVITVASKSGGAADEFPEPPKGPVVDVSAAPVVVIGVSGETSSYWSENDRLIFSETAFHVETTQRGTTPADISVRTLGGTVKDLTITVNGQRITFPELTLMAEHQPMFQAGEKSRLFLEPESDSTYTVVGLAEGKQDSQAANVAEAVTSCETGTPGNGYCLFRL